jgi:hypothetical protein
MLKNNHYSNAIIEDYDRTDSSRGGSRMDCLSIDSARLHGSAQNPGRLIECDEITGRLFHVILTPSVSPYARAGGSDLLLMDDNAPPHCVCIVDEYPEQDCTERMEWLARSPGMNPIEHGQNMLQEALLNQEIGASTLVELYSNIGASCRISYPSDPDHFKEVPSSLRCSRGTYPILN